MLSLRFSAGRSRFLDRHPKFMEPTAKVFVKVTFPGVDGDWLAQVDTGAAYSILELEAASKLGLLDVAGLQTRLGTRLGELRGQLIRIPLRLIADEGDSLVTEATFFVSSHWHGPTFLGYAGLLDKLRIALDSPANQFYFGEES
jgi:hypothetical protein